MLQETNRRTIIITCFGWDDGNKKKWYIILVKPASADICLWNVLVGSLGLFFREFSFDYSRAMYEGERRRETWWISLVTRWRLLMDLRGRRTVFRWEPGRRWSSCPTWKPSPAFLWIIKSGSLIKIVGHQPRAGRLLKFIKSRLWSTSRGLMGLVKYQQATNEPRMGEEEKKVSKTEMKLTTRGIS